MASINKLDDDVTNNILSRQPLLPLIQCKVVSKKWKDLVTEVAGGRAEKMHGVIVVNLVQPSFLDDGYWPEYSFKPEVHGVCELDLLGFLHSIGYNTLIHGCVNGLLLCSKTHFNNGNYNTGVTTYLVCNPVTRTWVTVPEAPPEHPYDVHVLLAFDPSFSPDYYKIVRWSWGRDSVTRETFSEVDFYCSRTGAWSERRRVAHQLELTYPSGESSTFTVFINGVVFRVADPKSVVALNVSGDVIPTAEVITAPYQEYSDETTERCLGKWPGNALCYIDYDKTRIKLWVLEDIERGKWVSKMVISLETLLSAGITSQFSGPLRPFCPLAFHSEKEEIILKVPKGVASYSLKKLRFERSYPLERRKRSRFGKLFPFTASFHCPWAVNR